MKYDENSIRKRKKRVSTLGKVLYIILIILIYNLVLVGISFISKQDFNGFFGYKAYNITTNSMEPTINIGDIIIVKKVNNEDKIKNGDIISFRKNSEVVTHRIIDITETNGEKRYITKGDNNNIPDLEKLSFSQIEGVKVISIPYLGRIVEFLENQIIFLIVILIILIIYLYRLNKTEKSELRRQKRREIKSHMK